MSDFIHPCYGCKLTSPFGPRTHPVTRKPHTPHKGVDFAKAGNIPILAAATGTVREAREIGSYGYAIVIQHDINGKRMDTVYAHMRKGLEVKKGDKVRQGQRIGFMSNTGMSTGQHLHFELHDGAWTTGQPNAVDPMPYITENEVAKPVTPPVQTIKTQGGMGMKISNEGLELIKKYEGFQENAYLCPANVWTIGFGTTKWGDGKAVKKGDKITKKQALELLEKQVNEHATSIEGYIKIKLTQSQFDALASFQYNLGKHILNNDKALVKYINAKDWANATRVMQMYVKANGKVLQGLVNRRKAEVELFMKKEEKNVFLFSSPALESIVKNIMSDKEKQTEIVNKAAASGIINKIWVDKFKQDEQSNHDILGICVMFTLSK